jgi:hypothetical protein
MKVWKALGSIAAATFLAYGWTWTEWLTSNKYISNEARVGVLVIIGAVFLGQQIYLVLPAPTSRASIESKRVFIESHLTNFLRKYYIILENIGVTEYPRVRACIMLPTRKRNVISWQYLQIYFTACMDGDAYSGSEKEMKWYKGKGASGFSWELQQQHIFDEVDSRFKKPSSTLNDAQKQTVGHVKSIISTPLWHDGQIVGIFNLDSEESVRETHFLNNDVQNEISRFAGEIASQFDKNGIIA